MSSPQIWNTEKEKDREKEKVGDRPAKLNEKRERSRARDKKQKRHFCWKNKMKFRSGGQKMRNASGQQCKVKMRGSEKKKVNKKLGKFSLEVSRCGRAKQRQRNVQKKCAARAKLLFC